MPQLSKKLVATTRAALLHLRPGQSTVQRRFIAIGCRSNGSFIDEVLLEVGLVAISDGEIHDYRHSIRPREGWSPSGDLHTGVPPTASAQEVVTNDESESKELDDAFAWLSLGEGDRLTLVGNGVRTLVDY